jgi:hypothetical protein
MTESAVLSEIAGLRAGLVAIEGRIEELRMAVAHMQAKQALEARIAAQEEKWKIPHELYVARLARWEQIAPLAE